MKKVLAIAILFSVLGTSCKKEEGAQSQVEPPVQVKVLDPNFYIFLSFGQSNMEGHAPFEPQDMVVDKRFQVLEGLTCDNLHRSEGYWYTAVPPLCRCNTGLTPGDYFGRSLVSALPANIRIGIINVSVGGTSIVLFDKNGYQNYVNNAPDWLKGVVNEYGGNPYGRLIELAKIAQKDGVIKGILLHQGEADNGDASWPNKVKGVYTNILNDLNLKSASVPLLAGEVVNADQGGLAAGMNKIIATLPDVIPNSYVISSAGCPAGPDSLHFTAEGYRMLGKRYAAKMMPLLGY